MKQISLCIPLLAAPAALAAEPLVVTDIAPIHALVSRVMEGVGTPDLLVDQSASPHGFSLRVSQARALEQANLVIWVGPGLTPWLNEPLETIAQNATILPLIDVPGLELLSYREEHEDHEGHDDHDDHADHDDHDDHKDHDDHADHDDHDDHKDHDDHAYHDDHDDHKDHDDHADHDDHDDHKDHDDHADHDDHDDHKDHDDHADHDDHDDHKDHDDHADHDEHKDDEDHAGHDAHEGHDHSASDFDPHAWLDPAIASVWLGAIADALGEVDAENAALYHSNAEAAQAEMAALDAELTEALNGFGATPYVVLHDAYQYFENAYGLSFGGSVLDDAGASQGPQQLAELRAHIEEEGIVCLFIEPQLSASLVATVSENLEIKSEVIDPLGADLALGPAFYPALMRGITASVVGCLTP